MPARSGAVHVATSRRVYKGKTYVTHLLRRSIRKGRTVTHETLGNLSHLPDHLIEIIKRSLRGETFVPAAETFRITRSLPHGHVDAVLTMIRKLGVEELIASKRSRRRNLVIAMIAEHCSSRAPSWPIPATGTTPLWPRSWISPTPLRITSTTPWTGCSCGSRPSRKSSPADTSARGRWCSTTSPAATTRGRHARWPALATTATARPAARSSSTVC